jgi:16S rRNA G966 N2-methylase RsmD
MSSDLAQFILQHEHDDPIKILLSKKSIQGYPAEFIANQLDCRKRAKEKLPSWYANPEIVYPPKQNLEQCSSEITAKAKADFIKAIIQNGTLVDLTGGLGIDSYFFSGVFKKVIHVEPNDKLCELAKDNHQRIGASNIEYSTQTAEGFLKTLSTQVDWIYLDPSRKSEGKKVVRLSDCEPDVTQLLPSILAKTGQILIKTAPLLDIKEGLKQLPSTRTVLVVSVHNECKEVLFHLQKDFGDEPQIECINIQSGGEERFTFLFSEEAGVSSSFSEPLDFIYEPNASILKAGAFKKIGKEFCLNKLAVNTHLYTNKDHLTNFPGRVFKILGDISAQAQLLPEGKANIISRNHPLSPEDIKKKYKLKDGGDKYVLAFSGEKKKYLLVADRLK